MTTIREAIAAHDFFADIDPRWLDTVALGAYDLEVRGGERLFFQGDPADVLYLITHGRFVLRAHGVDRTCADVDTADAGDVLGWSWMIPPRRWTFDASATADSSVIVIDAMRLRDECDATPVFGYQMMTRVAEVMHHRLVAARGRLLGAAKDHHGR